MFCCLMALKPVSEPYCQSMQNVFRENAIQKTHFRWSIWQYCSTQGVKITDLPNTVMQTSWKIKKHVWLLRKQMQNNYRAIIILQYWQSKSHYIKAHCASLPNVEYSWDMEFHHFQMYDIAEILNVEYSWDIANRCPTTPNNWNTIRSQVW